MLKTRIIPTLLLKNGVLVKTSKFKNPRYIGDPINAIKIFNDKEANELLILDIEATKRGSIDHSLLARINKEAFMPLGYGGGIRRIEDISRILQAGYEKVVLDSVVFEDEGFIERAAALCGSQAVVCCLDIKRNAFQDHFIFDYRMNKIKKIDPVTMAKRCEQLGAGELIVYSIDNEGTFSGYDLKVINDISANVRIPIIALGGAGKLEDFSEVINKTGASAVAAGSFFVFHGPHKAVLITYPDGKTISKLFG